jgi:hypothetical protein
MLGGKAVSVGVFDGMGVNVGWGIGVFISVGSITSGERVGVGLKDGTRARQASRRIIKGNKTRERGLAFI